MAPIGHISDKIYRAEGIYTERNNEDTICLNKHCIGSRQEKEQKISSTRLGVDKVKAKGWLKYSLHIDLRSSVGLFLHVLHGTHKLYSKLESDVTNSSEVSSHTNSKDKTRQGELIATQKLLLFL